MMQSMEPVLRDLSATSLAKATKENLYAFFRSFQSSAGAEVVEKDGLLR